MEYRQTTDIEVRADGDSIGRVTITPITYGVRDSYGTWWKRGVFKDFLDSGQSPVLAWGHDIRDVVGQMVDYQDGEKSLSMNMQLDDPTAVPRARQALAQLKPNPHTGKPTIRSVSVGFERQDWEDDDNGETHFTRCRLPEVSLVADGAVPGAVVHGVRSVARGTVVEAVNQLRAGDMTIDEALIYIRRAAGAEFEQRAMHSHAMQDGSGVKKHSHVGDTAMHAHTGMMPMKVYRQVEVAELETPVLSPVVAGERTRVEVAAAMAVLRRAR